MWQLPLLAAVVGYVFAAGVWAQFAYRRRPHQLFWALGLSAYAFASAIDAWVAVNGWSAGLYRVYFVLAAGNVGLLGTGTMHLLRDARWGRVFALLTLVGVTVALFAPWELPIGALVEGAGTDLGGKAVPFSNPGRVAFLLLNVVGGLALIGGALWSYAQSRRPGLLLIGLGALVPFLGGSASTLGALDARILAQFVGILVMYAGYAWGARST